MSQQKLKMWKFEELQAKQWPVFWVGFLLLKKSSNSENTAKSSAFWLSVWKKWRLEKGIAKEIENYELTPLKTLLERSYAEIKKKHG